MRVNSGVNPAASSFTTEDSTPPAQNSPAPATDPQTGQNAAALPLESGKKLEGQLHAFLFRSHLGSGLEESASAAKGTSSSTALSSSAAPAFAGMRLGVNNYGEEVRVTKDLGPAQGYDNRLQAIAVARMTGADPAAVIQSNDGKWHPVQTNANFAGGLQAAADTPTRAVEGLPSSASINQVRANFRELRSDLQQLNNQIGELNRDGKSIPPDLQAQSDKIAQELQRVSQELGSLVFGVPESEIQLNRSPHEDSVGKINIDLGKNMPGAGDTHEVKGGTAFSISLDRLDQPSEAAGTMFHEISHVQDAKLSQKWLDKFRQEKTSFGNSPDDLKSFQDWIKTNSGGQQLQKYLAQQPGLSKADAEVVEDAAAGANASTEARAYVHSALTALKSGDFDALKDQFKSYALAIKKGQTANPLPGSETLKSLTQELRSAFQKMPKDQQDQFRAAVAAAKTVDPQAWIANLDFAK